MVKIVVTRALPETALERLRALGEVWVSSYPRPLTVQELHETAARRLCAGDDADGPGRRPAARRRRAPT